MTKFKLVATSAMGLESIVAEEVQALGYETQRENGKVYFEGDETAIARANLMVACSRSCENCGSAVPCYEHLINYLKVQKQSQWEKLFTSGCSFSGNR